MSTTPTSWDRFAEIIEAAIGVNSPYPSATQLAAHRAKQTLREKQFDNEETAEEAQ